MVNIYVTKKGCTLNITVGIYAPDKAYGTITAQGRQSPTGNGGFVFNGCTVTGNGKALLGRAWEPYARVIFYRSKFSDVILPIGWDAWRAKGQEYIKFSSLNFLFYFVSHHFTHFNMIFEMYNTMSY